MKQRLLKSAKKFLAGDFGRVFFYLLFVLVALKLFGVLFLQQFNNDALFADVSKTVLIDLLNKEREMFGEGALTENSQLNRAALLKGQDMLQNGYFSHQSPGGVSPWYWFGRADYAYQFAGENLGVGFLDSLELHQAWNESASHKANLLSPVYREVGIAVLKGNFQGNPDTTVVVQLFGAPQTKPLQLAPASYAPTKESGEAPLPVTSIALEKSVAGEAISATRPNKQIGFVARLKMAFLRFMVERYDHWLSNFSFAALIFTLFYLGYAALHNFKQRKKNILVACLCLVLALTLLDKSLILKIIPHYPVIY